MKFALTIPNCTALLKFGLDKHNTKNSKELSTELKLVSA